MKQKFKKICILFFLLFLSFNGFSGKIKKTTNTGTPIKSLSSQSGCTRATSEISLDINNVRATLLNGGDMWWNLSDAKYEIPKVNPGGIIKTSLFCGALWIGGMDVGGNLKTAYQTYRQDGNDYYPGPLNSNGDITAQQCINYDKHFKINPTIIKDFITAYLNGEVTNGNYSIPDDIVNWPAHGNTSLGEPEYLAPYENVYNIDDGVYDPLDGDYPAVLGDQSIWWVINDKGNNHTSTGGVPIGLEIQTIAFAFATSNELNDATFYDYTIINRSTNTLNKTYFGHWVDPDLGNYQDDFIGCDVSRGMGFCYNGDDNDENTSYNNGYGLNPPAIGIDFLRGPLADSGDGVDNDRDDVIDETGEQIKMSNFLYYDNSGDPKKGNPNDVSDFYNYLRNYWMDGTNCTYDFKDGTDSGFAKTNFMFPGNSDPSGKWTGTSAPWDETIANDTAGDRRFIQSAGPFTFTPGQVTKITVGVIWAKADSGGALASLQKMKEADDMIQNFFDSGLILSVKNPGEIVKSKQKESFHFTVLPNPGNYNQQINYSVRERTSFSMEIFNINGSTMYQSSISSLSPGDYSLNLNQISKKWSSGIYVIRFSVGNKNYFGKVVKS